MSNALVVQKTRLLNRLILIAQHNMSACSDKQRYSIQNQAGFHCGLCPCPWLTIVRTYADEGESGLRISKTEAGLRRLIQDITSGEADFDHCLVYDVSRWGRFPDTDESAHYEFGL